MSNLWIFWLSLWKQNSWKRINFNNILDEVLKILKINKSEINQNIQKNLKFIKCFDINDDIKSEDYLLKNWFELVWKYSKNDIELLKNLDSDVKQEIIEWKILISFIFKNITDIQKVVLVRVKLTSEEYNKLVSEKIEKIFEKWSKLTI